RLDDPALEAGEAVGAGRADVEPGGHAGARRDRVRLDAPVRAAPVDVRVEVDEAGGDDLAGRVDQLADVVGRQVAVDRRDPIADDPDVEASALVGAGIDELAALDQQVEAHSATSSGGGIVSVS